jgi:hypothetical protein
MSVTRSVGALETLERLAAFIRMVPRRADIGLLPGRRSARGA